MNKKLIALSSATIIGVMTFIFVAKGVNGVAAAEDERFRIKGSTLTAYLGTDTFVSIPDTVTTIGEEAFAGNETLTGIEIPDSVSVISYNSFKDCTALKDIYLSDSVNKVGPGAFEGCTSLEIAEIGKNVKSWGTGVFTNCDKLSKVIIDEENEHITYYNGAIYNGNMTMLYQVLPGREGENYVMPDTVENIDTYAFWNLQNTKNVLLSDRVKVIPSYAFSNMNTVENVVIKNGVNTVERGAFANSTNLKQLVVPASVKSIEKTAFSNCPVVKVLTDKNTYAEGFCKEKSITVIYDKEFPTDFMDSNAELDEKPNVGEAGNSNTGELMNSDGNSSLNVTVENEITGTVQNGSGESDMNFEQNTSNQYFNPTSQYVHPLDVPEEDDVKGKTVIVAGNAVVLMNNSQGKVYTGDDSASKDDNETENIKTEASTELETEENEETQQTESTLDEEIQETNTSISITVNKEQKSIEQRAYYKQKDLTEFVIDKDITNIGRLAFSESGIKEIIIPENVETIEYGAFLSCSSLEKVTLSDKVTDIGTKAFAGTPWINNWLNKTDDSNDSDFLIVGDGILLAYRGTAADVVIPNEVKQIGAEAFKEHTEIVSVHIPESVTKICAEAFRNCSSLKSISGGDNLEIIIRGAFYGTQISEDNF